MNYHQEMSTEETKELQQRLSDVRLLEEQDIDGIFGKKTKDALEQYLKLKEEQPLPSKPWWESRRGVGIVKLAAGGVVTVLAMFWSGASDIDVNQAIDLVYDAGPIVQQLIEIGGALLAAFGLGQSFWGAIKAERPLDASLVAKFKGKEVRLPSLQNKNKMKEVDEWLGRK